MLDRVPGFLAGSLLVLVVAACAASGPPATTAIPVPVVTPAAFAIRTPAQEPQACMDALTSGTLVRNVASGLGLAGDGAPPMVVEWPFGYSAIEDNGRVSLLDETGAVVAREGDAITVGGGFGNQLWHACGRVTLTDGG